MSEDKFASPFTPLAEERIREIIEEHPIHPWRWRLLFVLFALLCVATYLAIKATAPVVDLQKTDCGLKQFLLTARATRISAAENDEGVLRQKDLQAARGYGQIVNRFTHKSTGHCEIPARLLRPIPKN